MKINISDMFDHMQDLAPDINISETNKFDAASNRIKEKTLKKIHDKNTDRPRTRRLKKPALAAILIAAALALCGSAYAYIKWTGFAFSGDLSSAEKESIEAPASKTSSAIVDGDGNVTYFDENGNELMTLTPEEDEEYLNNLREEKEKAVQESTDKVDVKTFEYSPSGITELPTDKAGAFDDFMMGNGNAVIFYPEGADGYELKKGDTVTLSFKTDKAIYIEFGYILDSSAHELATLADKNFSAGMEIPEDGTYCFYIINASSEVNEFTDGNITIN